MNQDATQTTEPTIAVAIETPSIADLAPEADVTGGRNNIKQLGLAVAPPTGP